MKDCLLKFTVLLVVFATLFSCSIGSRRASQRTEISINNAISEIEPFKRDEYEVLEPTTGLASSSQFYLLFLPIGRHKTNAELYDNAYYEAVSNLPDADGLILPRQKVKKLIIPLLIVNYYRRAVEVTGLGISVKGKTKVKK